MKPFFSVQQQVRCPGANVWISPTRRLSYSELHNTHWDLCRRTQCLLVQTWLRRIASRNPLHPWRQEWSVWEEPWGWVSYTELCLQPPQEEPQPLWCWDLLLCCGLMWRDTVWKWDQAGYKVKWRGPDENPGASLHHENWSSTVLPDHLRHSLFQEEIVPIFECIWF